MIDQNPDFGATLRVQRERRGITLDALAASMKIRRSLLVDLERNDVSRWPEGIYGRAYIRQYAVLVGLSPEIVARQFYQRFPDPPESRRLRTETPVSSAELRLTLDAMASGRRPATPSRAVDVIGILGMVLVTSGVLALMTGLSFWAVLGVVALIWYPLAGVMFGGGVSLRHVRGIPLWRNEPSRAAQARPLVLDVAGSAHERTDQTFEGDRAERDEEHGLPLPSPGQVH